MPNWGKLDKDKNFGDIPDRAVAQANLGMSTFTLGPLTENTAITQLNNNPGGPQRALFFITQADASEDLEDGFNVTWPDPETPTLATPLVAFSGADTVDPSFGSVAAFELVTADGIIWFGRSVATYQPEE